MRFIFFIAFFIFFNSLNGQAIYFCSKYDHNDKNATYFENEYAINGIKQGRKGNSKIVLPVVVHIIHNNGSENISDGTASKAIEYLNEAYQNNNIFYSSNGVDMEIEFCLASRKPDGGITSGIERYISEDTDMSIRKSHSTNVETAFWDPNSYINIWVVKNVCNSGNCGSAGYATYPYAHGQYGDGVVIQSDYMGSSKLKSAALVHELGHYLGLLHTFENGCKNDDCKLDGDKVCDTPPDNFASTFLPCIDRLNSCSTDDNDASSNNPFRSEILGGIGDQPDKNHNYMDYTDYNCYESFTLGQKSRAHFFLENARKSLLDSKGCSPPCINIVAASFTLNKTEFLSGDMITVKNNSVNNINNLWYLNGILISDQNTPNLNNLKQGYYTLKLIGSSDKNLCNQDSLVINFSVSCPIKTEISYFLKDSILHFENNSKPELDFVFELKNPASEIVQFISKKDSAVIEEGSNILCLKVKNAYCTDSICKLIVRVRNGEEICNNSLDDDGNGLVDFFDKNCACTDSLFNGGCLTNCEYVPFGFEKVKLKLAWRTPSLNSEFLDSYFNFVIDNKNKRLVTPYVNGKWPNYENGVKFFDLKTGKYLKNLKYSENYFPSYSHIANFSIKDKVHYIADKGKSDFVLSDETGKIIWEDLPFKHDYYTTRIPKISDFNYDGIPEIYGSDVIINSTSGTVLFKGNFAKGCNPSPGNILFCANFASSISGDLTSNPGLELACGNVVYQPMINNLNGEVGNTSVQIVAPPPIKDGLTSIADIDLDGKLDVVVVRNNQYNDGGLWVWNPRNVTLMASGTVRTKFNSVGYSEGGIPFIGNVDDDCYPEIGVTFINELRMYKYDGSSTLKIMYILPTTDNSGFTGITMFDFNQDGKNELVYRDETYLRIIEGATGITIDSFELHSATGAEYPIVADIDDDGQAEILVNGFLPSEPDSLRIFCFESKGAPWAPARKVWNQTGYHVTNVNDDLTIPRQPQNNAAFFDTDSCAQKTCNQPYNNFMCQATYRTQDGCVKWPAVDMSIDIYDYACLGDSVTIRLAVRNQSTNAFKQDSVNLALYSNADNLPFYLQQLLWDKSKKADTVTITISNIGLNKIKARVNIPDGNASFTSSIKGLTQVLECDYDNNTDSLTLDLAKKTLDLGPDIVKCRTEVFTLHAGSDFISYFWSDGSQDSTYTASEAGLHKVVAYDQCNRKYEDELAIKIDNALIPSIGDMDKCEGDSINLIVAAGFKIIQWLPSNNVVCDTCDITKIVSDTSFNIIMVTTKNGCIDADTAIVTVKPLQRKSMASSLCEGQIINFYSQVLSKTGIYIHKTGLCDSLITLTLKINKRDTTTITRQICRGDSIQVFGKWYKQAINATFKGSNVQGCDSIVNVSLSVFDTIRSTNKINVCDGDSININNTWLKETGKYKFLFQSTQGCDSLAEIELTINAIFNIKSSILICKDDSIKIGTSVYNKAGIYTQKLKTNQGCDSTLNITIGLMPSPSSQKILSLCIGDSILVFGSYKKSSGVFSQLYAAINGCDSTATITIQLIPLSTSKDTISMCEGDSILLFGKYVNKAGTYLQKYKSSQGCDSTAFALLIIAPFIRESRAIKLCQGDTITISGKAIIQAGTYMDTTIVNGNCKKIIAHKVEIIPAITESMAYMLCPDDSIKINNKYYVDAGTYSIKLQSKLGCDSTLTATIAKLSWPDKPSIQVDCDKQLYTATMTTTDPWSHTWPDGSNGNPYSFNNGVLKVKTSTATGCEKTYRQDLPDIPNPSDIPTLGDKTITGNTGINLSIPLDSKAWKVQWKPASLVSCDTCFNTTITTDRDTTIDVSLLHESGCTFSQSFRIIVEDNTIISLPNIFYPSSTSGNNAWIINLPIGYTISELNVYDRWADKVFSANNTSNVAWDGTFNEQAVVSGVYVYQLKIVDSKGRVTVKVGDVTVMR